MERHAKTLAFAGFACAAFALTMPTVADDPVFFSFHRHFVGGSWPDELPFPESGTTSTYIYAPAPARSCDLQDWTIEGANGDYTLDAWTAMATAGKPIAILLFASNAPWGTGPYWDDDGSTHPRDPLCSKPWQLPFAFAYQYSLDTSLYTTQVNYVLCDIETAHVNSEDMTDVDAMLNRIDKVVRARHSSGVTGDPFDTGEINVPQSVVNSEWNPIWFGNYGTHRYPFNVVWDEGEEEWVNEYYDVTGINLQQGTKAAIKGQNDAFIDNELNVIMPVTYVIDLDAMHTGAMHWSGTSPTVRAAYIWASVEKLSSAIREEISLGDLNDKKLIPWVSPYGDKTPNETPSDEGSDAGYMPPPADFLAIIKHQRLRGTDGFYYFGGAFNDPLSPTNDFTQQNWFAYDEEDESQNPWFYEDVEWADEDGLEGTAWFEANAIISWEELDGDFADDSVVYRLDTDKTSVNIVSAMNDKGHLCILVSHMDDTSTNVDIDAYFPEARDYTGMSPTQNLAVTSYEHVYTVNFFTPDIDGDGDADCDDLIAYVALVNAADFRTDWDQDEDIDATDIGYFFDAWEAMSGVSYLTCL